MRVFKDQTGREWTVTVNVWEAKRAGDLLGVNILQLASGDPPLLVRLYTDFIFIVDVLWAFCKPQADAKGITEQQFAEAMMGDGLANAHGALMEELTDFFRQNRRPEMVAMLTTQAKIAAEGMALAASQIERIDARAALSKTLGELSTSLPGSSASIPVP